jgi:hypothetical protein
MNDALLVESAFVPGGLRVTDQPRSLNQQQNTPRRIHRTRLHRNRRQITRQPMLVAGKLR